MFILAARPSPTSRRKQLRNARLRLDGRNERRRGGEKEWNTALFVPDWERSAAQLIAGASDSAQRGDATGNQTERRAGIQPAAPAGGDGGVIQKQILTPPYEPKPLRVRYAMWNYNSEFIYALRTKQLSFYQTI